VTAEIGRAAVVGEGTTVWPWSTVRDGARVGAGCVIGRYVMIGPDVTVGDRCKVEDGASLYGPAVIGDGVFIGPGAILTNDRHPRAVTPGGRPKAVGEWARRGVVVDEGASIGAGAVCVAPVRIGAWALVGAGSVVTRDVGPYELVAGAPARQIGWVGHAGVQLARTGPGRYECGETGDVFGEHEGVLDRTAEEAA
jgi:UDP-2-acetamido-3-amino-2,3-dideoxy-glucuronate N-acetyltransferase